MITEKHSPALTLGGPPMTPAQRARNAAEFAAIDGTICPTCGDPITTQVPRMTNSKWRAYIACKCHAHLALASPRYRAVAMALAAYRAAGRAGE